MSLAPVREEMLQAYVDELLSPGERSEFERYLAQHPNEAERVSAYRRQRQLLRETFEPVLREGVPDRLAAHRLGARRRAWQRIAAAVGWMALGIVLGWGIRDQRPPATTSADAELVHRARVAHTIYAAETRRAVEVAASQEQDMIRWLSKRMNAAVRVPDLTAFGFETMGGRLLPGAEGPACQIMYQSAAGKRLTIYLSRDPGAAKPVRFSDQQTVHVVFWSDGTLAFAVSAELDREELSRIAAAIARASGPRG